MTVVGATMASGLPPTSHGAAVEVASAVVGPCLRDCGRVGKVQGFLGSSRHCGRVGKVQGLMGRGVVRTCVAPTPRPWYRRPPTVLAVSREALQKGIIKVVEDLTAEDTMEIVGCGRPGDGVSWSIKYRGAGIHDVRH